MHMIMKLLILLYRPFLHHQCYSGMDSGVFYKDSTVDSEFV